MHFWGEICAEPKADALGVDLPEDTDCPESFFVNSSLLRRELGDIWDSLLITAGQDSTLSLILPFQDGRLLSSQGANVGNEPTSKSQVLTEVQTELTRTTVNSLKFTPEDAFDMLKGASNMPAGPLVGGASLKYWSRAASLLGELLAKQRFVPAIRRVGDSHYRGYWRPIVDEPGVTERLHQLIEAMPPLCRFSEESPDSQQATVLVEDFFSATTDAIVRRCLRNDELAHALVEKENSSGAPVTKWIRSLVQDQPELEGPEEELRTIHDAVQGWVGQLAPPSIEDSLQTCFQLIPPKQSELSPIELDSTASPASEEELASRKAQAAKWKIRAYARMNDDPESLIDLVELAHDSGKAQTLFSRPLDDAHEKIRQDIKKAARYFPPIEPCSQLDGPAHCDIDIADAYSFLRDAAPVLEAEGFGIVLPKWWRQERPKLHLMLNVKPQDEGSGSSGTTGNSMRLDSLVDYDWRVAVGDLELSIEEISKLATANQPLVKLKNQWAEIQPTDIEAAIKFLQKSQTGSMTLMEALRAGYLAEDSETGLPVGTLRAEGWINQFLNASEEDASITSVGQPPEFKGTLRPYQQRGLDWLAFLHKHGMGSCLADDMGLGKTIQLIALLEHERTNSEAPGPTLLIVPMSLVGNWNREIERFAPSLRVMVHHGLDRLSGEQFAIEASNCDVVISTYGLAHRDQKHLAQVQWYRITLDEAQNIKNPSAKQSVAVRSLRAANRIALTGTPVENRLSELWSIADFLNPGYLGSPTDFRRRFALPIERQHDRDRAACLRKLIRPFVLRRLKSDPGVLDDLPEKLEMTVYCNLTKEQAGLYQALVDSMMTQIDDSGGIQRRGLILATLVKLKQVCNHPVHFLSDGTALPHRSGKCDRLTEMLEEAVSEDDSALVFTQFKVMGQLLEQHLAEKIGRPILFLHGGVPRKKRDEMVQKFQSPNQDHPILILSLKAGGFGLNLTEANHVFHYDRWWNPAVENQATDRAHRIGQTKQVQVHKFVCIGTLEERISEMIEEKQKLADHVIGSGEEWLTELSTEKLRELFALSQEAVADE